MKKILVFTVFLLSIISTFAQHPEKHYLLLKKDNEMLKGVIVSFHDDTVCFKKDIHGIYQRVISMDDVKDYGTIKYLKMKQKKEKLLSKSKTAGMFLRSFAVKQFIILMSPFILYPALISGSIVVTTILGGIGFVLGISSISDMYKAGVLLDPLNAIKYAGIPLWDNSENIQNK